MKIHYYRPTYILMAALCALASGVVLALAGKGVAEARPGPTIAMALILGLFLAGVAWHAAWIARRAHLPAVAFDAGGIAFPIFDVGPLDWSRIRQVRLSSLLGRHELFIHFEPPAPSLSWTVTLFGGFWRNRRAGHLRFNMKRMDCGRDSLDMALREYCPAHLRRD